MPSSFRNQATIGRHLPRAREEITRRSAADIGANVGTTWIPRVVLGDFSVCYAAEPEPGNYEALVQTIAENQLLGLILPERLALSDEDGEVSLAIGAAMGTHELLVDPNVDRNVPRTAVVTVPTERFDTWVTRRGIDIDRLGFVKCDAQGWEGNVLRGAAKTLAARHVVWQLELWPQGLATAGFAVDELVDIVGGAFTHVIDLRHRSGERLWKASDLKSLIDALPPGKFTEILLYNGSELRSS